LIKNLHIENYAIIESIDVDFDASLNILTGETGAGKSIVLGALSLLMGKRVDTKVLYKDQNKCIIEASFEHKDKRINALLEANDLDVDHDVIIRREILPTGKSRAFVNDTPTTLKVLQELSIHLVDLNQQFDLMEIQNTDFHLNMLDGISGNLNKLEKYQLQYQSFTEKQKRLAQLQEAASAALKERDFIKFQFDELSKASLIVGEKTKAEADLTRLSSTEELSTLVQETNFLMEESEANLVDQLITLSNKWEKYIDVAPQIKHLYEQLNSVIEELRSCNSESASINRILDADPMRLEELNQRLDLIYNLEKKHQVKSLDELIVIQNDLENQLQSFSNDEAEINQLEKEIVQLNKQLTELAADLAKKRKAKSSSLEKMINDRLKSLSMPNAKVKVDIQTRTQFNKYGLDDVEILFAPNKGSSFMSIKKVASGGETARLMLCMKSAVATVLKMPSLIFDEIDTGVSGEVALKMGNLLSELARDHQVIVITHSPQVASKARKHLHIFKEDIKNRTITRLKVLEKEDRVVELAKMLSGDPPSKSAISNAKELMLYDN